MIGWLACSLALVRVDAYCVAHFFTFQTFSARATIFRTPQSCKFHLHRDFSTPGIFLHKGFFSPIFSELNKKFVRLLRKLRTHSCADHFAAWVVQTHHSPRAQYMIIDRTSATNINITPLPYCRARDSRDDGSERMQPLWQSPHPWNSFHCWRRSLTASIFYKGK